MELIDISPQQTRYARILQRTANALCYTRMIAGPLVGAYIAKERNYRSWRLAGTIGALAITDAIDGKLARKAATIDPTVKSQRGAWLDQMADKVFTHAILGGITVNVARTSRSEAAFLATNQIVQLGRDVVVTNIRKHAAEHNVPTNAQMLGKIKAAELLTSSILMTSPLADSAAGEATAVVGIAAGTALSVASGISLADSLKAGIDVTEKVRIEEEPAFVPTLAVEV